MVVLGNPRGPSCTVILEHTDRDKRALLVASSVGNAISEGGKTRALGNR